MSTPKPAVRIIIATIVVISLISTLVVGSEAEKREYQRGNEILDTGMIGPAVEIFAGLRSVKARASWALLVFEDKVDSRERGQIQFFPEKASQVVKEVFSELLELAHTDPDAARILASLYRSGIGLKRDGSYAAELFKWSASKGDARAKAILGIMCRDGDHVPVDNKRAFELVCGSMRSGYQMGKLLYADFHDKGIGVPVDRVTYKNWVKDAANANLVDAMVESALIERIESEKDIKSQHFDWALTDLYFTEEWLSKASEKGFVPAKRALAAFYRIVDINEKKSFSLYREAADCGTSSSLLDLGAAFITGLGGSSDLSKGKHYLERALEAAKREGDTKNEKLIGSILEFSDLRIGVYDKLKWDISPKSVVNELKASKYEMAEKQFFRSGNSYGLSEFGSPFYSESSSYFYSSFCGMPTLDGTPCMHRVLGGGPCWQHR